jgi:energy-coupling factor transporter ATP-binding protein EcfA2
MVRLAFAVMVQADADVMLIDEVLAVGDAAFAQKCMDVFREKRSAGRTIVLVTHDMSTVQGLCDRAMLIHDGELRYIGDAEETALRYYRINFGTADRRDGEDGPAAVPDVHARVVDSWLEDESGQRIENVEQGTPIGLNVLVEAREELAKPIFALHVLDQDGGAIFGLETTPKGPGGEPVERIAAGGRVRIAGRIENPLLPGRYLLQCFVYREGAARGALQAIQLPGFVVFGTRPGPGIVSVRGDVEAVAEP